MAGATADAAATVRGVVKALSEIEGVLAGERDGRWEGKAAEAFRNSVADELTPRVERALSSFVQRRDHGLGDRKVHRPAPGHPRTAEAAGAG